MNIATLEGYYTYRSLLNNPDPVEDFNTIKFGEAELYLHFREDGSVTGTLAFPADAAAEQKEFMDISGRTISWEPVQIHFSAKGRPGSEIADFDYEYDCRVVHSWTEATPPQRVTLAGTVIRRKDHGTAKAGASASFIAVKRDMLEAREVPGSALIPQVVAMLASRKHRLQHTVWHTLRGDWWHPNMTADDRSYLKSLKWYFNDPPFRQDGSLDLTNGAGEDFLFMHRRMIQMVKEAYDSAGKPAPAGWVTLPAAGSPQFVYKEDTSVPSGPTRYVYDSAQSGFMVPPATDEFLSQFPEQSKPNFTFLKSDRFFSTVMRNVEQWLRQPRLLALLTLGAYGNLIEMTIHNWMHIRWASVPRDPQTGEIAGRDGYDVDERWDHPSNDYMGDFHSSHVNPLFWKLHGWADDRIEDWFRAHEASNPGQVERKTLKGVSWFAKGPWVLKNNPFAWPEASGRHDHSDHSHDGADQEVEAMLKVMKRLQEIDQRTQPAMLARAAGQRRLSGFARLVDMVEPERALSAAGL